MAVLVAADADLLEADVVVEEVETVRRANESMFTPWACGLGEDKIVGQADRCSDIIPELIVELI